MPTRRRRKKPQVEPPPPIIEAAPEPELTLERIFSIARKNGHIVNHGPQYVVDIDYAAWCSRCGAHASWVDEDTKTEMNPVSMFMRVYNRSCSGPSG
jgi:hypothetical protein